MSSGIQVTEVRRVPNVFTYKRNAKNGVVLNFQPSSQVRFEPTNGSGDCNFGSKITFKIADDKHFWLVNETLHKYRVVGLDANRQEIVSATATHRLCQSGTDAVWKRQSVLINGRIIEDLNDYNLFTAHENALTSWETKQHLGQCEYYSSDVANDCSAVVAKNRAYTVTGSSLSFFQNEVAFPLCLVKGGVQVEMTAESELAKIFPTSTGIDSFKIVQNELICQFAEPIPEYYNKILSLMESNEYLTIPMQVVWSQEFAGQASRVQQLSLVTGEQSSVSSLMLVTTDNVRTDVDKLNFSEDAGIRTVSIQVGTQRFPEGKAIANGSARAGTNIIPTVDPEMYALSQRNKDFNDVRFAPTMSDLEGWALAGKKIQHWSWRQNFKQSPDMIGGGLNTLADGHILINVSQYPNPPEVADFPSPTLADGTTANPDYIQTFKDKTFHVFWTTDHEMRIDRDGVRLLPA
ncbi:uncharacterized protein SPPG_07208 [Spizellomyces punctatus DAOM BR117]|uniref:Uncharacterized protein n=1 Tax=Spizellomyces punctatus (strain DAOM BR117) TaxID=645134 RepID=A0A0L0H8M9_SPIPD|nr:uncharacterized protein SPPG_07208 [Spizellomyces punctatus DAOM BR117]KNC97279.1 hypothetical protein SPPG_07208 [Spizellomyces punctatus DAOM BR117]|eukprot:XP_016605319.1 hypothetical protein SPPG_07208 [Spizellomyces punctatus DAOM BR117]